MERKTICRFCGILAGQYAYKGIDEPFADSEEFVAIASIGALVEGWTLVIPKEHQLSLRNCYLNNDFTDLVNDLLPKMSSKFGSSIIAFEHGANKEGSVTSCGTDHAHLHLVPFGNSLKYDMQNSGLDWVQCNSSDISYAAGGKEYLYYCDINQDNTWGDPEGYLHVLERPISQYFRSLIANKIGFGAESNYKLFPHLDVSRNTRMMFVDSVA